MAQRKIDKEIQKHQMAPIKRHNYNLAIEKISQQLLTQADSPLLYIQRALLNYKLNDKQKASTDIRKALELEPENKDALMLLAKVFSLEGNYNKSIETISTIIEGISRESSDLHSRLAKNNWDANSFQNAYYLAQAYLQRSKVEGISKNYSQAIADLTVAIYIKEQLPISPTQNAVLLKLELIQLYKQRAELCRITKNYNLAIEDYNSALKLNSSGEDNSTYLNPSKTVILYQRQSELLMQRSRTHSDPLLKTADLQKVIANCEIIAKLKPTQNLHAIFAVTYLNLQEFDKALDHANKQIRLDNSTPARFSRVQIYLCLGKIDKALEDLSIGLKGNLDLEKRKTFLITRGEIYQKQNQFDKALADFTALLTLDPTNARILAFRMKLHMDNNEYQSALADVNVLLNSNSQNDSLYAFRAMFNNKLGYHAEARADFWSSMDLLFQRGLDQQKLGNHSRAISLFQEYLKRIDTLNGKEEKSCDISEGLPSLELKSSLYSSVIFANYYHDYENPVHRQTVELATKVLEKTQEESVVHKQSSPHSFFNPASKPQKPVELQDFMPYIA